MIGTVASHPTVLVAHPCAALADLNIAERRLAVELRRKLYGRVDFVTGLSDDFINRDYGKHHHGL